MMNYLVHHLLTAHAQQSPHSIAVRYKDQQISYSSCEQMVHNMATGLRRNCAVRNGTRVVCFLGQCPEVVYSLFACSITASIFIPINPIFKPNQVTHIINDCTANVLITNADRLVALLPSLQSCASLTHIVLTDRPQKPIHINQTVTTLSQWQVQQSPAVDAMAIDADTAVILYTSGSTGKPKGVVLSHRNICVGAQSVAQYLHNRRTDRILTVLPLSFDYGLSQITTAFYSGASVVLINYLLPKDVLRAVLKYQITGLAAVPPLWIQLARLAWPQEVLDNLRYITNSGGAMPTSTLQSLRKALPNTNIFLMYGLTEAFRSTYLAANEVDLRPDSIGKAIPNAQIMVLRPDGSHCAPNEPGELVHRGALVALGYWNDPVRTAQCFKPFPMQPRELPLTEIAVWSGDTVRMDTQGYLYFLGRNDAMIKTSGYRVSPSEIEAVLYGIEEITEAIALGIPHPLLGQAIAVCVTVKPHCKLNVTKLSQYCSQNLPHFMQPAHIEVRPQLPRNANGKIDRKFISEELKTLFSNPSQQIP